MASLVPRPQNNGFRSASSCPESRAAQDRWQVPSDLFCLEIVNTCMRSCGFCNDYHQWGGLKQHTFIFFQLEVRSLKSVSMG